MAEKITISAHAHSSSVAARMLRSTSLNSHSWGKIAATVTKPNGGNKTFLSTNARIFS